MQKAAGVSRRSKKREIRDMRASLRARIVTVNDPAERGGAVLACSYRAEVRTLDHASTPLGRLLCLPAVPRRTRSPPRRFGEARGRLAVLPRDIRPRGGRGLPDAPALERRGG